jgi:hypothetical protein
MLEERLQGGTVVRLIRKWLKALSFLPSLMHAATAVPVILIME